MPVSAFLFAALVFVLAGMVKGITGMGLPTVAIALLPILLPIGLAASLLVMPVDFHVKLTRGGCGTNLGLVKRRFRGCVGTRLD